MVNSPAPGVTFTQLSAGGSHSLGVGSDGNAYAWGGNETGELGIGSTESQNAPTLVVSPVPGVTFAQVDAGGSHSLNLGSDGLAYASGNNANGQLGNGTLEKANVPVLVTPPGPGVMFTQVSAGEQHGVGIGSDGNTYAWGHNLSSQLGNGTTEGQIRPALVTSPGLGVVLTQVAAGARHSVALSSDGDVYAWGYNGEGQVGDGSGITRPTPIRVSFPAPGITFTKVVANGLNSMAIASDGSVYGWGYNIDGELGVGDTTPRYEPTLVTAPAPGVTFTDLAMGQYHSIGVGSDGKVYSWGRNVEGQLGTGGGADQLTPVPIHLDTAVSSITFDGIAGTDLVDNGDGTWSVTTPPHAAGPVDVGMEWTLDGVQQAPVTYSDGFTYVEPGTAPTITSPIDVTVEEGNVATFTVEPAGDPAPNVSWEVSTDGGVTWQAVTPSAAVTVSEDGRVLSVVTETKHTGHQFRATATNAVGSVTSEAAVLTVTVKDTGGNGNGNGNGNGGPGNGDRPGVVGSGPGGGKGSGNLAQTGDRSAAPALAGVLLALASGAAIVVYSRRKAARP